MLGAAGAANAASVSEPSATAVEASQNSATSILGSKDQTTELLNVINKIPVSVLEQGDAATKQWVSNNLRSEGTSPKGTVSTSDFVGCSGAILFAIGSAAIPAAKILKIKRYMNALGGTTEAIKILWGASFSSEKLAALGGAAGALGAELLGITAVKEACTG